MDNTDSFGQWLRQRRKALNLTQKELAQQAGCAEITLRKIEAGDLQPSAALVTSLARRLRVAEADLPGLT
ncbi:MAG TPA: helix-turn-helix transcriptional regulator, partial [Anaerolineae bacterium]|nr:helix-turn-helix transcriptional regulator [Anaerolineae bacterium]